MRVINFSTDWFSYTAFILPTEILKPNDESKSNKTSRFNYLKTAISQRAQNWNTHVLIIIRMQV